MATDSCLPVTNMTGPPLPRPAGSLAPPPPPPGVAVDSASSVSASAPPPSVDARWAGLAAQPTDAVVVLCVDDEGPVGRDDGAAWGGGSAAGGAHAAAVEVTGRRARLGWEAPPGAAARPAPPGPAARRVAVYGGGGDPVEDDELYAAESAARVRVALHAARLRAASPRFAADLDRTGSSVLLLAVPRSRNRAALTLFRSLYERDALPPATDGGTQLLLADVLTLARGWGAAAVAAACTARFAAAPPGRLAWAVAVRLGAMVSAETAAGEVVVPPAAADDCSDDNDADADADGSGRGGRPPPGQADISFLCEALQVQVLGAAAAAVAAEEGTGPATPPSPSSPHHHHRHHRHHHPPAFLPLGADLDFILDSPRLRAAWAALPGAAVVRLLRDDKCAAASENSAIAAAALWLAGGLDCERVADPASSARAPWAPALASCLILERASPLYAAAAPYFAPWVLGGDGGGGGAAAAGAPSTAGLPPDAAAAWAAAAAPRAARPVRPPSVVGPLNMEYAADAAAASSLVAAATGGAHPPPTTLLPSPPRFFRGLFWHLSVEPCQADATKAGLFMHASYPPVPPAVAEAVREGRAAAARAAASSGGCPAEAATLAALLPCPPARPPAGAAWVITQRPASSAVAPLRLAMASVWPATSSYGLAGIRGMADEEGGPGAWVKDGRLRFSVSVSEVL